MTTISILLSAERLKKLSDRATQLGLTSEEFLRRRVEEILDQPDDAFRKAAASVMQLGLTSEEFLRQLDQPDDAFTKAASYVMQKNAELYRRLA